MDIQFSVHMRLYNYLQSLLCRDHWVMGVLAGKDLNVYK